MTCCTLNLVTCTPMYPVQISFDMRPFLGIESSPLIF